MQTDRIIHGDMREVLAGLPAESVDCVVTLLPVMPAPRLAKQPFMWYNHVGR